jgi:hypothetical protein
MMTLGEIKSLTTHLATMRDDWPQHQILYEVNKLAEEGYSVADLTAACAEVASSKQYAVTILGIVVPEVITDRHAQPAKTKRRRRYQPDAARICDICTKPETVCQSTAANLGRLRDHDFLSVEDATEQRANARNPQVVIAEADLFNLPEDV